MSISLALFPVALALRVVMGKQRFDSWVESLQLKIETSFQDEKDLIVTVRKAGYDAENWGGAIKTHVNGEEFFFFWEQVEGKWTAIFSKSDPQPEIKRFIRNLEKKAGRNIFKWSEDNQKVVVMPTKTFPTNFRDDSLITKTLMEYNLNPILEADGVINCKAGKCQLIFRKEGEGPFNVEVRNAPDVRQIYQQLDDINDVYCQNVQAKTYQNLKSRIAEKGLTIEQEEVLEDNSIVITLNVHN